jgi:UPF0716 protein FxsA
MRIKLFPLLTALFVGLPLLDTVALVMLGSHIGFWTTVALVLVSGVAGAWLMKRQGMMVWLGIRRDFSEGRIPTDGLMDAAMLLVAGGMLIAPGFLTDFVGMSLLLPPVRAALRVVLRRYFAGRVAVRRSFGPY